MEKITIWEGVAIPAVLGLLSLDIRQGFSAFCPRAIQVAHPSL